MEKGVVGLINKMPSGALKARNFLRSDVGDSGRQVACLLPRRATAWVYQLTNLNP